MSESQDMAGGDALDGAFGGDSGGDYGGGDYGGEDDKMGDDLDIAAAQSDAKEMPADGGKEDSVADAKPEADDGIPKVDEDDKTLDG